MLPIPAGLTEVTSREIFQQIEQQSISIPAWQDSILTTYVRQGKGEKPLVLLHGFDSSLLEFRRLLPLLAQERETWALDLLGFGFTQRNPHFPYGSEGIKTHLYHFWQQLIQKPIILVGASMGGAAAIDFTITYPQVVERLVLIDSAGLTNPPLAGKLMFPPVSNWATAFLKNPKVRKNISLSAYHDKSWASLDAQLCASLHLECPGWSESLIAFTKQGGYGSFAQKLGIITQPTLIIWGERDRILGVKAASEFKKGIPNSQLCWIPDCGHVPHLEKASLTAAQILQNLDGKKREDFVKIVTKEDP